ncbi:MAG: serine/threonine-protein kinase [Oscillospiraceae bacterium]
MSNETILNNLTQAAPATLLNSGSAPQATVVNTQSQAGIGIPAGTALADGYTVIGSMNTSAGEADLFLCEKNGLQYAAKLYRRQTGIKPEVIEALNGVESPYVARLYYTGEYCGRPLVILPYYKNGSLQGRTFSADELKNVIIPNINEGLHALHSAGIIHKDLKPSNIMLNDDCKTVSIIDFGISSVRKDGSTVLVTSTGMTPEYSAPETFRSLYLEESDYYSFGVTIYELFCGHSPYKGLSPEEIARYTSLQRIPFPEQMPEELKALIGALTYYDITNRNNTADPNRRWTYREVCMWLGGNAPIEPHSPAASMPAYKFCGEKYTEIHTLALALAENWNEGKKQLFRGLLSGFFRTFDPEIAGHCIDAEEAAERTNHNEDVIFFTTLYRICPTLTQFCWRGQIFDSTAELGRQLLDKLRGGSGDLALYGDIPANKLLSLYYAEHSAAGSAVEALKATEDEYARCVSNEEIEALLYKLGYLLVPKDERVFIHSGSRFADLNGLVKYLARLSADDPDAFDSFCEEMFDESGRLDPQFEAWLYACGKRAALEKWKNRNEDIGGTQ